MGALTIILFLIILVVLLTLKGEINTKIAVLQDEIRQLRKLLNEQSLKNTSSIKDIPVAEKIQKPSTENLYNEDQWKSGFKVVEQHEVESQPLEEKQTESFERAAAAFVTEPALENVVPIKEIPQPKPTFFERNPDLEKFIGENLINKIGIAILVLAIAYFVKFAIDNNWIGEVGRVAIGLICGGILIAIAHRMRVSYKAFSSILVGGGLAVFYFTIALAFHQFHLFGQATAFIIMLVITVFAVALALLYNKQEVAIIGLVGGFASPFMVSNGNGDYRTLFIYLIVLNLGLLVIAYNKAWRLLNLLAFIFTVILVGGWLFALPITEGVSTYRNGFVFCTIFYLLFFAINLAHNIKENKRFIASDFGILLINTSLYFAAGLFCLYSMQESEYKGIFSIAMGIFNLTASYIFFKNKKVDTNILYLLIGITLTFVSLTGPLQMNGNFITLFWASEAVLLCWLYQKSKIKIIEITSVIVWLCMLISLVMDWFNVYADYSKALAIVINKGFITTVYASVASYVLYILKLADNVTGEKNKPTVSISSIIFFVASFVLLFFAGALEINHQFLFYYPTSDINYQYIEMYTFAYVLVFLLISERLSTFRLSSFIEEVLLIGCVLFYLAMINGSFGMQTVALKRGINSLHYNISHWIGALLMAGIIYRIINLIRKSKFDVDIATWLICIVIIIYLSVEMNLLTRELFYNNGNPFEEIRRVYIKTVLPILWGLSSFVFMWLGMHYKFRSLRIISLSLFSLTLIKLFVFDLQNIPVAGKIAAFFCLGVLLLVVSFMYQRLKKIIIEDEQKPAL